MERLPRSRSFDGPVSPTVGSDILRRSRSLEEGLASAGRAQHNEDILRIHHSQSLYEQASPVVGSDTYHHLSVPHPLEGPASSSAGGSRGERPDIFHRSRSLREQAPYTESAPEQTSHLTGTPGSRSDFHRLDNMMSRSLPELAPSAGSLDLRANFRSLPDLTSHPIESLGNNGFGDNETGLTGYHAELPGNDVEMGLNRSIDADSPTNPSWISSVWEKTKKRCFTPPGDAPAIPLLTRDSMSRHTYFNYLEIRLRRALLTQAGDVPVNAAVAGLNALYTSYAAGHVLPEAVAAMFVSAYGANKVLDYVRAKPYGVVAQAMAGTIINIGITAAIRAAKS